MPLRNSMKVPRLTGQSTSARYLSVQLIKRLRLSSPWHETTRRQDGASKRAHRGRCLYQVLLQTLHLERLAIFERVESVFGKAPVHDVKEVLSKLLLGLGQIRAAHDTCKVYQDRAHAPNKKSNTESPACSWQTELTHGHALPQLLEELKHVRRYNLQQQPAYA
eukprot:1937013-Rhodomonas_salina.1